MHAISYQKLLADFHCSLVHAACWVHIGVARIYAAGMHLIFTPKVDDLLLIVFNVQSILLN